MQKYIKVPLPKNLFSKCLGDFFITVLKNKLFSQLTKQYGHTPLQIAEVMPKEPQGSIYFGEIK